MKETSLQTPSIATFQDCKVFLSVQLGLKRNIMAFPQMLIEVELERLKD